MRQWTALFAIFILMFSFPCSASAQSGSFLIMDGRTLDVLEGENADQRLPMASTTKVMTALVTLDTVGLSEKVSVPPEAVGVEGSSLYVKAGEIYTVEELLYALLLQSANDCAAVLAWYAGGEDVKVFVEKMNQKATELGLKDTHFANPHGLSAEGHYTTARELAVIMAEALKNKDFCRITGAKKYTIGNKTVVNHNRLLSLYPACIGGKTGYTMEAGRCLVTAAQREGTTLICVTLGRRDDWNIHTSAYEKWFSSLETVSLAEKGAVSVKLPVAGGGIVSAINNDAVTARLFQYDGSAETRVIAPSFLYGEKATGAVVGTVEFWYRGMRIGESPLVLTEPIEVSVQKDLFISRIFRFFRRLILKNG